MTDWYLSFSIPQSLAIEELEQALAAFVGVSVATDYGELDGNPRDYYARSASIRCHRGDVQLDFGFTQHFNSTTDPNPITEFIYVTLHAPTASFATKLATWHALRDALAAIGCVDRTLEARAARIVDDVEAAGDAALAAQLRAEITAALVACARTARTIQLTSPGADLETVLAAYDRADEIGAATLEDCRVRALPAAFARFKNIEALTLVEQNIDGDVLRGLSLPRLSSLSLSGSSVQRLHHDDVAGFPSLAMLYLQSSRLRELDPDIIETCPRLSRVMIESTPLSRNADAVAALRTRWANVSLEL